jgi:hypothetical protein
VGTLSLPKTSTLLAGKTTKIVVPVSVNWPNIAALGRLTAIGNVVPYSVDGTLEMGGTLLHVGVPFHFEGSVPHDQIVSAALNSIPGLSR